jgi:hypothetical protein
MLYRPIHNAHRLRLPRKPRGIATLVAWEFTSQRGSRRRLILRDDDRRGVEVEFVHLAISEDDILGFDDDTKLLHVQLGNFRRWLPTREPRRNTAADKAGPFEYACELDASEPDDLRALGDRAAPARRSVAEPNNNRVTSSLAHMSKISGG